MGISPDEEKGLDMFSFDMFTGLNAEICRDAWVMCNASIVAAAHLGTTNKLAGTIVVLDPWSGEIMFQARVDDRRPLKPEYEEVAQKYDAIALSKARVGWQTGLTSRQVQQDAPHLYLSGMTKWGGSAIENKLVVAFSGVQAVFDECIAWNMLKWIIAICQNEMTKPDGIMASESAYIPLEDFDIADDEGHK